MAKKKKKKKKKQITRKNACSGSVTQEEQRCVSEAIRMPSAFSLEGWKYTLNDRATCTCFSHFW